MTTNLSLDQGGQDSLDKCKSYDTYTAVHRITVYGQEDWHFKGTVNLYSDGTIIVQDEVERAIYQIFPNQSYWIDSGYEDELVYVYDAIIFALSTKNLIHPINSQATAVLKENDTDFKTSYYDTLSAFDEHRTKKITEIKEKNKEIKELKKQLAAAEKLLEEYRKDEEIYVIDLHQCRCGRNQCS